MGAKASKLALKNEVPDLILNASGVGTRYLIRLYLFKKSLVLKEFHHLPFIQLAYLFWLL